MSFGHGDGGGVPSGGCLWLPSPSPGVASSCQRGLGQQRGCSLLWKVCAQGGPSSVLGRPGTRPFVPPRALCHWRVSVPVLWLPVPAAEHDAGLRADRHLPACDTAEPHRLQGQGEQGLPCLPPPPSLRLCSRFTVAVASLFFLCLWILSLMFFRSKTYFL